MKTILKTACIIVLSGLCFFSCKKDYYDDSGTHNANYNGTIWQYLETRPDLFDTLIVALKLSQLDNVLKNEEVTFFAPSDQTILKTVWELNAYLYTLGRDTITSLDQVSPDVWRKYLSRYILKGKYLAKDFPQLDTLNLAAFPGQGYINYAGEDMNIGVLYNDVVTENSDGVKQTIKYAGYRQLYYNYPYPNSSTDEENSFFLPFITAPVATSDIQPTNGVLHVLQFSKHNFGYESYYFIQDVWATGIIDK